MPRDWRKDGRFRIEKSVFRIAVASRMTRDIPPPTKERLWGVRGREETKEWLWGFIENEGKEFHSWELRLLGNTFPRYLVISVLWGI